MKRKNMIINNRIAALLALALGAGNALAVDGTWILNGNTNWSNNTTAWSGNVIADGVGATGTFQLTLSNPNKTITLDSDRTLGIWKLGQGGRSLNFVSSNSAVLTLDNTGSTNAQINVIAAGNQNIAAGSMPIALMDSVDINNLVPNGKSLALGTITVKSGASNSGNLTITNVSVGGGSPTTNFGGAISDGAGTISLEQKTAGFSNLAVANSFSGTTTVSGGVLRLDNALALQNSAFNTTGSILGDSVGNGGSGNGLRINTGVTTLTLGGLTGNKNLAATGGVIATTSGGYNQVTALTLNPGTGKSHSYSGAIENGAANMTLTKTGLGTQTLTGTSTYSGDTLVSAGTLFVNGSLSSATNDVTVGSAGTIGGDGSIAGSLAFASGADFVFSTTNTLDVSGAVTFGGFGIADLVGLDSTVAVGTYTLINGSVDFTNVINVGLANAYDLGGGKSAYLQSGSLQVVVVAIPEPGAALLCGLGLLTLHRRRRD